MFRCPVTPFLPVGVRLINYMILNLNLIYFLEE